MPACKTAYDDDDDVYRKGDKLCILLSAKIIIIDTFKWVFNMIELIFYDDLNL